MSARAELRAVGPTPLEDALPRLRSFVSPYSGVIRSLGETLAAPDEHRLISIGCQLADARPTIGETLDWYTGSEHVQREQAEAAAIGEALERYAGSYIPEDRLVVGSAAELGRVAVDPGRFALFSDEQYASEGFYFSRFAADTVVSWVEGFSLPHGEPALLPAQLVYMPWRRRRHHEVQIGHATSSGLACAPTLEEAILTGLLELVERDAFMLAWRNRLSLPLLDWSEDAELVRIDERYFARTGLRYSAVDLSSFLGIPGALGVVHGPSGQLGALGVGAGSAPTVAVAWRKALAEAFSVQRWVRDMAFEDPERLGRPAEEIATFDAHTLYYATEERAACASFLDSSDSRTSTTSVRALEGTDVLELIHSVTSRLEVRGVSAYAVDVSTPDIRAADLRVVHVVAPELCPLDVVQGASFLGGRRLYEAAYEAGLASRPFRPAEINTDPHPFP